jgi:hypothetical protein
VSFSLAPSFFADLRALAVFALGLPGRFALEVFLFCAAAFGIDLRFLVAPIAAPDKAPITVPTTRTPKAVPAKAPAAAPPRALPVMLRRHPQARRLFLVVHAPLPNLVGMDLAAGTWLPSAVVPERQQRIALRIIASTRALRHVVGDNPESSQDVGNRIGCCPEEIDSIAVAVG